MKLVNNDEKILKDFGSADISEFPDFHNYSKPLEMGLWVLWVAKDKLGKKRLTAKQIALIIREVMETSIESNSIANAFNRAKNKNIHVHKNEETEFEIMKAGRDHLNALEKDESIDVIYFEPGKKFKSKKILSKEILSQLNGELRILDPYCDKKTLDILENVGNKKIKFLTKIDNIKDARKKRSFLRELQDFKSDYPTIEFRDYPNSDIHDRYVISADAFVVIGYSIKDFGKKETFITMFKKNRDIHKQLLDNFDMKWGISKFL